MKYNVIIADDLDEHVKLMSEPLVASRCFNVVFTTSNGREVIEYLSGKAPFNDAELFPQPHVVLLDLRLLQTKSFYVLRWITRRRAPVLPIVVTAFANPESAHKAIGLGATAVLMKPLLHEDIVSIVQLATAHFGESDRNGQKHRDPEPDHSDSRRQQ